MYLTITGEFTMDEKKELGFDLLGHKERKKLLNALDQGTEGREPTDEEKQALISWALQSRLNQELISLVNKDVLNIEMDTEEGFLLPQFKATEIGKEISQIIKEQNAQLEEEGTDILKEMTKDLEDNKD